MLNTEAAGREVCATPAATTLTRKTRSADLCEERPLLQHAHRDTDTGHLVDLTALGVSKLCWVRRASLAEAPFDIDTSRHQHHSQERLTIHPKAHEAGQPTWAGKTRSGVQLKRIRTVNWRKLHVRTDCWNETTSLQLLTCRTESKNFRSARFTQNTMQPVLTNFQHESQQWGDCVAVFISCMFLDFYFLFTFPHTVIVAKRKWGKLAAKV